MKKQLRCACAARAELARCEPAPGLGGRQCPVCEGLLLELEDYRSWRDKAAPQAEGPVPATATDSGARHCPACSRLMQRLRVGGNPDFRLDRCAPCQAVWFDRGEWPALLALGLGARLEEILSDAWQRQLQAEQLRQGREAALRQRHGDACIDEVTRIRQWLQEQPGRDELLSLLRAGW